MSENRNNTTREVKRNDKNYSNERSRKSPSPSKPTPRPTQKPSKENK